MRLRLLFLSQRFLYPLDTGGKIRTAKILEKLKERCDITLVSQVESPQDDPYLDEVKRLCSEFHAVPWRETRKYSSRFYLKVLARSLSRYPVTVINDYSRDLSRTLETVAKERGYDLLVCDFLQPSLNFRRLHGKPTLLFQHNVESMIPKRHCETATNPLLRLFWWSQWRKMVRFEQAQCQRFGGIVTVSETDKQVLETEFSAPRVFAIPTGVDTDYFRPDESAPEEGSLVFSGAMDWLPNEDAVIYFVEEILPRIRAQIPTVTLTLVGRNPSRRLLARIGDRPEVRVTGWVEDVRPFVKRSALYVIPLRIGGGTRIKAYEAMAMGKAVVSTPIGVEGLPLIDGEHVVQAEGAQAFADSVVGLLRDPKRRRRIERSARKLVERNFSWERAASVFLDACYAVAGV